MSYNTGVCLKRKILISLIISIFIISVFSITAFAQGTQQVHTEDNETKYVSSSDVNLVFDNVSLPDSKTITKSQLYESLSHKKIPTKIILDLKINSEDLITEDDLLMYLEELEKENIQSFWKGFAKTSAIVIGFLLFFIILSIPSPESALDYRNKFDDIKDMLGKIANNINNNTTETESQPTTKKRWR